MAKTHDYEVIRRENNDHRPGHYALAIDGIDCDVSCDPGQFAAEAMAKAGTVDPIELALFVDEYCQKRARAVMQRKADRIKAGRVGGKLLVSQGGRPPKSLDEDEAVHKFLNRGRLNGMSPEDRIKRRKSIVERRQRDLEADWRESRRKLIELRRKQLEEAKAEQAANPDRAHKIQKKINALEAQLADLEAATIVAATHGFQYAYGQYWQAGVNMTSADVRAVPAMTNTTADTVRDAVDTVSDVTIDEFDGANYSTGGIALASQAVNVDDGNDRAEFDCADFPDPAASYGAGTREIEGLLIIVFNTTLGGSLPLHWLEPASNWVPDGSAFQWIVNAEGLLQMADG